MINKIKRKLSRVGRRLFPGSLILLYHRIATPPLDPFGLSVTPRHFEEQLRVLRARARPMGLRQLSRALRDGTVPRRAAVVTFDDGYADNLHVAKPLLERYEVPATVFVASGYIGQDREYWWDELERLLLTPGTLPPELRLDLEEGVYRVELGAASTYTEQDRLRDGQRGRGDDGPTSARFGFFQSLWDLLRRLRVEPQRRVLRELHTWAGADPGARSGGRALTEDELVRLKEGPLVDVGAHTLNHPMLGALPADAQRGEIREGRARLEDMLGCSIDSFSYPYGSYDSETMATVRDVGFADACSTRAAVVRRRDSRYELPRFCPGDWDGEEFARRLHNWFAR